jgi:hypothetical protein
MATTAIKVQSILLKLSLAAFSPTAARPLPASTHTGVLALLRHGNMIGGFALVAWPANYGKTGVNTFIVNQLGRVYQKDLARTQTG